MSKLVYDDQPALLRWAAECIGLRCFRGDAKAFGVMSAGQLRAVVVWDTFSEVDCSMHVASRGDGHWLSRDALKMAFGYPFIDLKMRRVTALIPAKNTEAIRFNEHLGFKLEGLCPEAMPDDDIQIRGMLRRECRFIPPEYRQ
jgi:L-amino acid N-acyltransferase YncA